MKIFIILLFTSMLLVNSLQGVCTRDSSLGGDIKSVTSQEPLFVSLGSYCVTAHMHRDCGIRKAAFPFDWITSFDGEKMIELLAEDFCHFLNPDFLRVSGQALLNDYYHLEFLNEGDREDANYKVDEFINKCQRRINRFRQLANYSGKVFFVRTAYLHSMTDPHRIWRVQENVVITQEYSDRLFNALLNIFPNLDFKLIIVNHSPEEGFSIDTPSSERVLMVNINEKLDTYRLFYENLLKKI